MPSDYEPLGTKKCEDLALCGFSTRRFPDLLTDLAEMATYVDA